MDFDHPIWRGIDGYRRTREWSGYQDPVVGYIRMPPLLRQALDRPAVQRLRSVRQSSGLDLVYPGATHTRFEHAVGVMWLAGLAHDVLEQKRADIGAARGWPELGVATKVAVMLAGLFHDLGHGPYSHTYDMFLEREREPPPDHNHEARTFACVVSKDPEHGVGSFVELVHKALASESVTAAGLLRPENVAALCTSNPLVDEQGNREHLRDYLCLGSIVSGKFDVDRLDYLRRDARHIGLPVAIDPDEIMSAYTLARVTREAPYASADRPPAPGAMPPEDELVWTLKLESHAAARYENFLAVRDASYRRLFYHRTHRAGQEMLILALQRLTGSPPEDPTSTSALGSPSHVERWTDQELLAHMQDTNDLLLRTLHDGFVSRRLYQPLPTSIHIDRWPQLAVDRLAQLQTSHNEELRRTMRELARTLGVESKRPPERILVDVSRTPVEKAEAYASRAFIDEDGGGQVIADEKDPSRAQRVGWSLNELLPHVNTQHGYRRIDEQGHFVRSPDGSYVPATLRLEPAHPAYVAEMQSILIFVPESFISRMHVEIKGQWAGRVAIADRFQRELLSRIVTAVWSLFAQAFVEAVPELPDGTKHRSFVDAEQELDRWIHSDVAFPPTGERVMPPFLD